MYNLFAQIIHYIHLRFEFLVFCPVIILLLHGHESIVRGAAILLISPPEGDWSGYQRTNGRPPWAEFYRW